MSNPTNNNLNDFLENRNRGELDDFEREALEGFDMLESSNEAAEIKNSLDERIYKEVFFNKEEKKRSGIYWFAAAGLVLVIGLTTFFVLNNSDKIGGQNVAVVDSKEEGKKEAKIEDLTPPVQSAEFEQKAEEKRPEKDIKVVTKAEDQKQETNIPAEDLTNNGPGNNNLKTRSIPAKAISQSKDNESASYERTNNSSVVNPVPSEEKSALDEAEKKETIADSKDKITDKLAATGAVNTSPSYSGISTPDANKNAEMVTVVEKESKKREKSGRSKKSKSMAGSVPSESRAEDDTDARQKDLAKTDQSSTNGYATTKGNTNNAPASTVSMNSNENQCYYKGGEVSLTEDIRKELKSKNTDKKFDATLYVNENKTVTKVNFTNSFDLTGDEKNKVIDILKSLSKFEFYISPNTKTLFEFKISYRP